jgi:uncharacterized protein YvpB
MIKMTIKLDVKAFKQESQDGCGAAALRSMLDFFGKTMSEKEITEKAGGVQKGEGHYGILAINLATMLRKLGYKVHAYTYDMGLFKPELAHIGRDELIKNIGILKEDLVKSNKKTSESIADSILHLLENNQDVKIKIPDKEDIIYFLKKGLPVLISVKAMLLEEDSKINRDVGHYIVVNGYDEDKRTFSFADPFYGKVWDVEEMRLMFSWHHNAIDSSAYLLAFEPK